MVHIDGPVGGNKEPSFFATCVGRSISEADARALSVEHIDMIKGVKRNSRRIDGTSTATTQTFQIHIGPTATPQAGSSIDFWVLELDGRLLTDGTLDALTVDERQRVAWRPFLFWRAGSVVMQSALGDVIRRNAAMLDSAIARVAPRHHRDMMVASAPFEIMLPDACAKVLTSIPPDQTSNIVERDGNTYMTIHLRIHPDHAVCNCTINHAEFGDTQVRADLHAHDCTKLQPTRHSHPMRFPRRRPANHLQTSTSTTWIFALFRQRAAVPFRRVVWRRQSLTTSLR